MYSNFLNLCGFTPEAVAEEEARIERTFRIWGIGAEDVKQAEERIEIFFE